MCVWWYSVYGISLGYELHILPCQHCNVFYFLRRFCLGKKLHHLQCVSVGHLLQAHRCTRVTISTFFKEVGTWSATTRIAGYTFTHSHFMHTNLHWLQQGTIRYSLSSQLHWQRESSRPKPFSSSLWFGGSLPTDMHRSQYNCRERGGICRKIEMAPSQPPLPHLLRRLFLYRHGTVKILGG